MRNIALTLVILFLAQPSFAINYGGELNIGISQVENLTPDEPESWWYFEASAGDTFELEIFDISSNMDPVAEIFFGYFPSIEYDSLPTIDSIIKDRYDHNGLLVDDNLLLQLDITETGIYSIGVWSDLPPLFEAPYTYSLKSKISRKPSAVPLPASLYLFASVLLLTGVLRRKKKSIK